MIELCLDNELLSENYELKNTIIDLRAQLEKKKNQDEYMNTLKQKLDALQQELAADSALRQSGTSDVQDNMDEFYNKVERKDKDLFEFVALVIWKAGGGKAVQKVLGILYDIYELSVECTADPSMDNDKIVVDTIKCLGKVLGIREYGKEAFKQMIADSNGNAGETINPEFQEYCESFNKRMKDMGDQIHAASAFEESSNEASSRDDPGTRRTTEPHTTTKKKGWGRFFNKKHKQSEANWCEYL